MAANTSPIFSLTPVSTITAAWTTGNNNYDGTNGTVALMYTAGTNGSYVRSIIGEALGTTGGATVLRVWVNNGSSVGTATNNALVAQFSLPSITASATAATAHMELPLNLQLPSGYKLYGVLGTTVTAGWIFVTTGGDY